MRDIVVSTLKSHSRMVPVEGDDSVYEVGADGKQLVQRLSAAVRNVAVQSHAALPPTRTKTKGFAGSGTAQDPIRIETAEDLVSMDDPDIATAGLHFIQTADIDCASITHWPSFAFKGHYDGNGKTIRNVIMVNEDTPASVFDILQATSSVTHLRLEGCCLAQTVDGSLVQHCHVTSSGLVSGDAKDTQITDCQVTGGGLVGGNIRDSQVARCQVLDGFPLVRGFTANSCISDCAVVLNGPLKDFASERSLGLISTWLDTESVVERCFGERRYPTRVGDRGVNFGGIVSSANSSIIRQCAVGSLDLGVDNDGFQQRILRHNSSATLQNNASIDTNPGDDDANGNDGKTVAAARFNQRFFEGSLGWDFDTVWQWDATNNRPTLRPSAGAAQPTAAASTTPMQDLLTRQVQANIWL